jgi:cytochrome b subunit of formate dehydrogenase
VTKPSATTAPHGLHVAFLSDTCFFTAFPVTFYSFTYSVWKKKAMLYISITLFALAAILGIVILKSWLTQGNTSRTVVYLHGVFAALGLALLVVLAIRNPEQDVTISIILFVIAALAGFYMFVRDLQGKFSPTALAVVHGLVAVAGFVFLLLKAI